MRWRDRLPVLAGTVAGIAAAAALTLLQSPTYRADASIALVRQGQPPGDDPALAQAAEAAADLFHSRAIAEPAVANLRLDGSAEELLDRVSVEAAAGSSLVRVAVEAPSPDEARRTAQELAELATVRFNDRFGPETVATVWEPSRAREDRVSPRPARNVAFGALAGALLGQLLLLWGRRARPGVMAAPAPEPVAHVVGEPGPATAPPQLAPPRAAPSRPEPAPTPVRPEPGPALPELVPVAVAAGPFVEPPLGEWTLHDVELLLAEQGHAFPELFDELGFYLESFRSVAGPDGGLPGGVEAIVEDVFGPLIARAGSTSAA